MLPWRTLPSLAAGRRSLSTPSIAYIDPLQPYQSINVERTVQIYQMAKKPQHRPLLLHDKNGMFVILHRRRLNKHHHPSRRRMSACFAILACCLLNIKCVDAVYNNLRQGLQQQEPSDKVAPIVSTNNCLEDQWHISIEHPTTCTNSQIFPSQWTKSSVRDYLFHSTSDKCCSDILEISDECYIINTCHTNNPEIKKALGRSLISTKCTQTKWHMSTETLYACTNDYNYPSAWDTSPTNNLFNSAEECCRVKYPTGGCSAIDTCPTPTPTVSYLLIVFKKYTCLCCSLLFDAAYSLCCVSYYIL